MEEHNMKIRDKLHASTGDKHTNSERVNKKEQRWREKHKESNN
jgi:hypothetical protein